jgi:hypothetical protein
VAALFGPNLFFFPKDWFLKKGIDFDIEEQLTFKANVLKINLVTARFYIMRVYNF